MRKDWGTRGRTAALPLGLLLAACSGGKTVDLGGNEQLLSAGGEVCDSSGIGRGSFYVGTYDALRKLEGCREIQGDLRIARLDNPDLTPLSELRVVDGELEVGAREYEWYVFLDPELVLVPGESEIADVDYELPQLGDVWFPSLAGLGSLESVERLTFEGIGVSDLAELASLRHVGSSLVIEGAPALRDLSGVEGVGISSLTLLLVPELVSLQGFTPALPLQLTHLNIAYAPKLVDISSLAGIESMDGIILSETGLQTLDALADLGWVQGPVTISYNQELVDITGLDSLYRVTFFELMNNPKLALVPPFTRLAHIESLQISGNDALEALDLTMPGLEDNVDEERNLPYAWPWRLLEVDYNSRLERLVMSQNARLMDEVRVRANQSLVELDLGGLESTDVLLINANPALSTVVAPAIRTVDELTVRDNPLLSLAPFAEVRTFVSDIVGNADELAP
jgi:hypothetical protein